MDIYRDEQGKIWLYSDKIQQNVIVRADDYDCAIEQMLSTLELFHVLLQIERAKINQIGLMVDRVHLLIKSDD